MKKYLILLFLLFTFVSAYSFEIEEVSNIEQVKEIDKSTQTSVLKKVEPIVETSAVQTTTIRSRRGLKRPSKQTDNAQLKGLEGANNNLQNTNSK